MKNRNYHSETLTKKQREQQELLFKLLREANEKEKTDGLTAEERWQRWLVGSN